MKKRIIATTAAVIVSTSVLIPATNTFAWTPSKTVYLTPQQTTQQPSQTVAPSTTQPSTPVSQPAPSVTQPSSNTSQPVTVPSTTTSGTLPSKTVVLSPNSTAQQSNNQAVQPAQPAPQPSAPAPTQPAPQPSTPTTPSAPTNNTNNGGLTTTVNSSRLTQAQVNAMVMEMFELVNNARVQHGLKPLILDQQLTQVAQIKSEDMVKNNYFSHTSPTYGTPFNMFRTFGISYKGGGENISRTISVQRAFNNWMNSPGHRANILQSKFTHIGIGIDRHPINVNGGQFVFTQMFVNR